MAHNVRLRGRNRIKEKISTNVKISNKVQGTADLDDAASRRYINSHKGGFWSVPNTDVQITQMGTAAVATTASGLVLRAHRDLWIRSVSAWSAVNPATSAIIVDCKLAGTATGTGTSIFLNAGARPTIAIATDSIANVGGTASFAGSAAYVLWPKGTFLRVEVAQVGAAPTGKDVTVQVETQLPI